MSDYMDRRVTPPKRVTSPAWGPPPPCKQALRLRVVDTMWPSSVDTCLRGFFSFGGGRGAGAQAALGVRCVVGFFTDEFLD